MSMLVQKMRSQPRDALPYEMLEVKVKQGIENTRRYARKDGDQENKPDQREDTQPLHKDNHTDTAD